jgi:rubrerythrin
MIEPEKPEETKEENQKLPILANGRGLALRSMEDMWRFACAVKNSGLAPSSFQSPEQILIAIQSGAELGMPPMRSLQSFCVINGAARLWGDTPLALVRQSGLLEYIKETIEGEGDEMAATCETKRKDDPESKITQFSMKDAKLAGLLDKKGSVWKQYPKRMLKYRARSFNLRDNFPDCFGGATIAEEYADIETPTESPTPSVPSREQRKEVDAKVKDTNHVVEQELNGFVKQLLEVIEADRGVVLYPDLPADAVIVKGILAEYAKAVLGDNGDYTDVSSFTIEKIATLKKHLAESELWPESVVDMLPISPFEAKEPEPEDQSRFHCNECNKDFPDKNENDCCPFCLSKKVVSKEKVKK